MGKLTNEKADKYLEDIITQTTNVLGVKAKEYVRNDDRLHNFNEGARQKNLIREEVLDGMRLKHTISRDDMINDLKEGKIPTKEYINEKYGDIVNYYILEWMSMLQRADNNSKLPFEYHGKI